MKFVKVAMQVLQISCCTHAECIHYNDNTNMHTRDMGI